MRKLIDLACPVGSGTGNLANTRLLFFILTCRLETASSEPSFAELAPLAFDVRRFCDISEVPYAISFISAELLVGTL